MALRGDSYSSTAQVMAYTRHLLDGETGFNTTTRPTHTEVETFINRASGVLNVHFWAMGFAPSVITANSTAKLVADDWVTTKAAQMVEITQRGTGYSDAEGSRTSVLAGLLGDAGEAASTMALGFKKLGLTVSDPSHQGLTFTALDKRSERADPDDTDREQPRFRRKLFDNE